MKLRKSIAQRLELQQRRFQLIHDSYKKRLTNFEKHEIQSQSSRLSNSSINCLQRGKNPAEELEKRGPKKLQNERKTLSSCTERKIFSKSLVVN